MKKYSLELIEIERETLQYLLFCFNVGVVVWFLLWSMSSAGIFFFSVFMIVVRIVIFIFLHSKVTRI